MEKRKWKSENGKEEEFTQRSQRKSTEYMEKEKKAERRDTEDAEKRGGGWAEFNRGVT
jgi:hypothetical protein